MHVFPCFRTNKEVLQLPTCKEIGTDTISYGTLWEPIVWPNILLNTILLLSFSWTILLSCSLSTKLCGCHMLSKQLGLNSSMCLSHDSISLKRNLTQASVVTLCGDGCSGHLRTRKLFWLPSTSSNLTLMNPLQYPHLAVSFKIMFSFSCPLSLLKVRDTFPERIIHRNSTKE